MAELPKILFISADQWRGDCLSALGHATVKTPNLDRLAADGVSFTRHFCQAAPCGPARASMLTGLYAMNHRSVLNGMPLDHRHSNIALEARKLGYEPMLFGYTDTSVDPRQHAPGDPRLTTYGGILPGFSVGFSYHQAEVPLEWLGQLRGQGYSLPAVPYETFIGRSDYPGAAERGHAYAAPVYSAEHSDTAFTADRVIDYLQQHRARPWFVHAVFLRPHPPLYAPEPYNAMYDPGAIMLPPRADSPETESRQHPFLRYWLAQQRAPGSYAGHPCNLQELPEHEIRQLQAAYFGLITEVDHNIGRILDYLRSSGEYDDTLIVFTSDHAEMLGEHWLWGKGGYFDASYHVPLLVRHPRHPVAAGRRVSAFSEAVDIMPTLLESMGATVPTQCDGHSLVPWLDGKDPSDWRQTVHWEFDFRDPLQQQPERDLGLSSDQCTLNVIRDQRYKYVHFSALPELFFDLQEDPHETRNLARDPGHQRLLLEYAQRLLSHRMVHAERTLTSTMLTAGGAVTR